MVKLLDELAQPLALAVTAKLDTPAVSIWWVLLVAVKPGRLPLPEVLARPILSPVLTQLKVAFG